MDLNIIKPECIYRIKIGGKNFVIVDEMHLYKDKNKKTLVVQNNKFHKRLYSENAYEEILFEIGKLRLWEEVLQGNRETALKSICSKLNNKADYIIFNAADSFNGMVLESKEILNDEINFKMDDDLPF